MFFLVDFVLFALFLLLSLLVGLYHSLAAHFGAASTSRQNRRDSSSKDDPLSSDNFLHGGRRLPIIPVCLSLLATFSSGIGLLSVPAEIYSRGSTIALFHLCGSMAFPFIALFFIPMFFKLKFLNAYEYFEHRFQSRALRRLATLMFTINTLFYMAVVIYAPAIAFAGVTELPVWPFILLVGVVSTAYTAAGGIKAVIWTDTLQAVFIYAGIGIIVIRGTAQVGGFWNVWEVNQRTGRLQAAFRLEPSLLQYNNLWIEIVGGLLKWTSVYGLNQMAMQRYCSMSSLQHARTVLYLTVPAKIVIYMMIFYIGFLMAAYFEGCNPLALGEVQTIDQMTILMASRIFEGVPGLPGMFLATIFSATLSTASSGINSLTAVLWEDFLKEPLSNMPDSRKTAIMKTISLFFGALAICISFACTNLESIIHYMLTIIGTTSGPLTGLFFLGIFFPSANKFGAFIAFACSSSVLLFCTLLNIIQMPYQNYAITDHSPTRNQSYASSGCVEYSGEEALWRTNLSNHYMDTHGVHLHYGDPDALALAKLSPFSYAGLGVLLVMLIGVPTSWAIKQRLNPLQKRLTYACTYKGLDVPLSNYATGNADSSQINRWMLADPEENKK